MCDSFRGSWYLAPEGAISNVWHYHFRWFCPLQDWPTLRQNCWVVPLICHVLPCLMGGVPHYSKPWWVNLNSLYDHPPSWMTQGHRYDVCCHRGHRVRWARTRLSKLCMLPQGKRDDQRAKKLADYRAAQCNNSTPLRAIRKYTDTLGSSYSYNI